MIHNRTKPAHRGGLLRDKKSAILAALRPATTWMQMVTQIVSDFSSPPGRHNLDAERDTQFIFFPAISPETFFIIVSFKIIKEQKRALFNA